MKYFIALIILGIIAYLIFGPDKSKDEEKESEKTETIAENVDSFTDYATGKTPIYAGQAMKAKLYQINIDNAVKSFQMNEGRNPTSLDDLVKGGHLEKRYILDEWNRPLISGVSKGKFFVRGIGRDKQPETADDWVISYPIRSTN